MDGNNNEPKCAGAEASGFDAIGARKSTYPENFKRTGNSVSWEIPRDTCDPPPSYSEVELSDMGARSLDEPLILCIVKERTMGFKLGQDVETIPQDETNEALHKYTVNLPQSSAVCDLYSEIAKQAAYEDGSFLLVWRSTNAGQQEEEVVLGENSTATLFEMQMQPRNAKNYFYLREKDDTPPRKRPPSSVDDNSVVAVNNAINRASSTTTSATQATSVHSSSTTSTTGEWASATGWTSSNWYTTAYPDTGFCGLVNQAMTCYLNSLLQSLYMTPEFRNAIYRCEFKSENAAKNIPYQLQRLFLRLQTSKKRAIETTDVTKSFGWDSSEAWQQHDVQELCRVMFDALETKLRGTNRADLINRLYQGIMKDYVKCLECRHESFRNDTFLDIPLAIKPFGSDTALKSVEEALAKFVEPEVLSGDNQYFCERCQKKCDAHKGLRFTHFPELLTFQLKRFDLDYATLQRIKLNDKMTFPVVLNLNPFLDQADRDKGKDVPDKPAACAMEGPDPSLPSEGQEDGSEDGTTHHSGEEKPPASADRHGDGDSACTSAVSQTPNQISRPQQEEDAIAEASRNGTYVYDLFSVMVHSGSALGGHYYAYIKSFKDKQWYLFNDHTVTMASVHDIERAYGGISSSRGYYSSAYSSSANAYMLMYRRISDSNETVMEVEDYPEHLKAMIAEEEKWEELEKRREQLEKEMCKLKLCYAHPQTGMIVEDRLEVHKDDTLAEATVQAHKIAGYGSAVPVDRCRLVRYDDYYDLIEMSWDGRENDPIHKLVGGVKSYYTFELLLETIKEGEEFRAYDENELVVKFRVVDVAEEVVANAVGPQKDIRLLPTVSVQEMKHKLAEACGLPKEKLQVMWEKFHGEVVPIKDHSLTLKDTGLHRRSKLFVGVADEANATDGGEALQQPMNILTSPLWLKVDSFLHLMTVEVYLPENFYTMKKKPAQAAESTTHAATEKAETTEQLLGKPPSFRVRIDKRKTLADLKEELEKKLDCEAKNFKMYRIYGNSQEFEMYRLQDSLQSNPDSIKVIIRRGRALLQDEWRVKIFHLDLSKVEYSKELVEVVVGKGQTIREVKEEILKVLAEEGITVDMDIDRMRLRKKQWRNPVEIYTDDMVVGKDVKVLLNMEYFIEKLSGPDPLQNPSHIQVYVRWWRPSEYKADPMAEVVVTTTGAMSVDELKKKISELSGIPHERVEIAKGYGTFPHEVSVLEIHDDLNWNLRCETLSSTPLYISTDGSVLYFRDSEEKLKELTKEEKDELRKQENQRLSKYHSSSYSSVASGSRYYSRKEKALKIYMEEEFAMVTNEAQASVDVGGVD